MSQAVDSSIGPDLIIQTAAKVGVTLDADRAAQLQGFGRLFMAWNERINLGGSIGAADLVARHFVDSFAASRFIGPGSGVADVGSGGGLPAIPLALVRPDLRLDLFEPTAKKVAFLRAAVRELGLKDYVAVHAERAEPRGAAGTGTFDVAMSRATLAPTDWLALGRTLVRGDGRVVVFGTGGPSDPEERAAEQLAYAPDRRVLVFASGIGSGSM